MGTPTGTVRVSDGTNICTAILPVLNCNLISLTVGAKNLNATYNGDSNYNVSPASTSIPHTVTAASTTVVITTKPDPSVFGQNHTVSANITGNSPDGTPSGTLISGWDIFNLKISQPDKPAFFR